MTCCGGQGRSLKSNGFVSVIKELGPLEYSIVDSSPEVNLSIVDLIEVPARLTSAADR